MVKIKQVFSFRSIDDAGRCATRDYTRENELLLYHNCLTTSNTCSGQPDICRLRDHAHTRDMTVDLDERSYYCIEKATYGTCLQSMFLTANLIEFCGKNYFINANKLPNEVNK